MEHQYLDLLSKILREGTPKGQARDNMPSTYLIFGHQMRCDLSKGFPLITTKPMYWKGVVEELLWFLRGQTNVKYLIDRGVNIWNDDAYRYYKQLCDKEGIGSMTKETFIKSLKNAESISDLMKDFTTLSYLEVSPLPKDYILGDCGYQYGKVWRRWPKTYIDREVNKDVEHIIGYNHPCVIVEWIDQVERVIESLKSNPEGRRHVITAIDPAHDKELALYWCHALYQFNCRRIPRKERQEIFGEVVVYMTDEELDKAGAPGFYLDCQLYQRSADSILGVPFNIASYALLTHIIAGICNMIPGEYIHTFGDVHIYADHIEAAKEQIGRRPNDMPRVCIDSRVDWQKVLENDFKDLTLQDFYLLDYKPHSPLTFETKLSTGL